MATITTVSHGNYQNTPRRTYIATRAFNNDFYSYTVTGPSQENNFTTTGALGAVSGATAALCPLGRTLRENGKKLYPGANPGITTYMVGVYDDQSGLNGFINPNSGVFAIFNTDKPTYLPDGSELAGGSLSGQNEGNAIYTRGDVVAGGQLRSFGTNSVTNITATATVDINAANGQVVTSSVVFTAVSQTGTYTCANVPARGSIVYLVVTTGTGHNTAGTLAFSTGIKASGSITLGATTAGKIYTITFVSDGTNLNEVSRSVNGNAGM